MTKLWTPPGTALPRATLPEGDVTLANGIVLAYGERETVLMIASYARMGLPAHGIRVYGAHTGMRVIASIDRTDRFGDLLHVSISFKDRNPSWREIRLVKDAFFGADRDAMMMLPREEDFINVHEHTFHLYQCPETWGIR